jgi:hypothetical protein
MAMVQKPGCVQGFIVLRTEKDKRSAFIKWKPVDNAFAYNIYYGTDPGKLYTSIMIHANNEYWMKAMDSKKHIITVLKPSMKVAYQKDLKSSK